MKVDAVELWHAVKNASVYSKKDGWAQAVQVHHHYDGTLRLSTSDDYIGIESRVHLGPEDLFQTFYLSHDSIKELEKGLRGRKGELEFNVSGPDGVLVVGEFSTKPLGCPDESWWEMFEYIMATGHDGSHDESAGPFEVDPTRLSKLNLLEPKGKYPLSWKRTTDGGKGVVAFRYGPATFGVVMPLDRSKLEEVYENLGDVVWTE